MPSTDAVSSMSGRNSRASNVSGVTGASRSICSQPTANPAPSNDGLGAGVLSMLKTSTDTGDIGALSFNHSRLPNMPRATHQKKGHHAPRHSGSFNPAAPHRRYAPSQTSGLSSSREWDSASNQQRGGSLTSMQSMPPSIPPVHLNKGPMQMPPAPADRMGDSRSYSLTSAPPAPQLPRHRSANSLKSQGHEPRHAPHLRPGQQAPPMPENCPPYVYPTRLKRPGYRSPSPALSETYPQAPPQGPGPSMPPQQFRRPPGPSRPLPQAFNSDYGTDYNNEPRHGMRPPPRAMSHSPASNYGEQSGQYPYRNPAAMRSAHGPPMSMHQQAGPPHPMQHGPPSSYQQIQHHPMQNQGMQQHPHMPPPPLQNPAMHHMQHPGRPGRQPHSGPPQSGRPGYPQYPPMQHQGQQRGPPPPPNQQGPMAHSMFHNAARMARNLPQRTDTPQTDMSPPSSDPPSSGTAPTSSSPPTPKDSTSTQVMVDPAFIDPALLDLPDSSSEPVLPHQYLHYAEGLEKQLDEPDTEPAHMSVPPSGFVQRVKAMLESKAAAEAAARSEAERERSSPAMSPYQPIQEECTEQLLGEYEEFHELAANETPRFTVIEEYEAPVELPASPVRVAELSGSPVPNSKRITREMVQTELAPSVDSTMMLTEAGAEADETMMQTNMAVHRKPSDASSSSPRHSPKPPVDHSAPRDEPPSTPARAPIKRHDDGSRPEMAASPDRGAPGLSTKDNAVRLSIPVDTTMASEDTESKDPFTLDADTITMQQRKSKENVDQTEPFDELDVPSASKHQPEVDTPVSPLLFGQDVSRCSAVSPMQTQTLGIDETVRRTPDPVHEDTTATASSSGNEDQTVPGAFPDEPQPPPTPRTPKTYSKSVQLQPNNSNTDSPSSNRLSLPPDLSTIGETTVNTTSDMVTDVAVRFSLPQTTTVTMTKPHVIEIPPSSPSEPPARDRARPPKPALQGTESKSKRGSVTFADEIAPLKISKKPKPQQPTHQYSTSDGASIEGKALVARTSPLQENAEASRAFRDSKTDLRFSNLTGINNKFGSTHLPGLKEESVEDMSISEKRATNMTGDFQFPLPARIAAVKAMQERRLEDSAQKAKARRAARHPNRTLAEIRDLPSLNFSRMDLIDKLNEALDVHSSRTLEVRSSKSIDIIRRRDFSGIHCPSPQRPQSTEPLRERYTSFFNKPEDFASLFGSLADESEEDTEMTQVESEPPLQIEPYFPTVEVQPNTEVDISEVGPRSFSPDEFLNVATQINRISIPSVAGLSARLSDILPDLRDLQLDSVLSNFNEEEIRRLGDGVRSGGMLSARTSAGFRTLAERAEEIVKNGTHDSTVPLAKLLMNKELPPLPESMSADNMSAGGRVEGREGYLSGSVSAPIGFTRASVRPASALARLKSPMSENEVHALLPPEMNPIARHGKRAMMISSPTSRPWNQDESYPWSGTQVDVDLTVPSQAHTRDSVATEMLRERTAKSLDLPSTRDITELTCGIDIGSILEHEPGPTLTAERLTGVSPKHTRKPSKRSVIGSITRKVGLTGVLGTSAAAKATADTSALRNLPSPGLQSNPSDVGSCHIAHKPGERYPTSGLTPPAGFNLDEVRSFFSDDSSEKERNASFRKRLTNFKSHKPKSHAALGSSAVRRPSTAAGTNAGVPPRSRSLDAANTTYDPGSLMTLERMHAGAHGGAGGWGGETGTNGSSVRTYDGVGMGKTEFRLKRLGEKLRGFFARGGVLIRSWSLKGSVRNGGGGSEGVGRGGTIGDEGGLRGRDRRGQRGRDDWLSDSLYSGV